ncbi:MAG: MarR family winged helix-turn-helix transcriptional regulator [Candidatus Saganbacteria bacterium]|nr:MarR family winged helix-turn-helix transcriptional regulator [Candidatus Saganbacteria bacterium]
MTEKDINAYVDKFGELMTMIGRTFGSAMPHGCGKADLTHVQFRVIYTLSHHDNSTMGDLSRIMEVTLGNMTMMIDRLVRYGYVLRAADPDDRRIVRVRLSEKSKKAMHTILNQRRKFLVHILSKLSAKDREDLLRIVAHVVEIPNK